MKIVNKTPHIVRVQAKEGGEIVEFLPDETPARASQTNEYLGEIGGLPIFSVKYGQVEGLPPFEEGTYYIVSAILRDAASAAGRTTKDLLIPDSGPTAVRKDGLVYAVRGMIVS